MWDRLKQITPPEGDVLALADAKAQCRLETTFTDDDTLLTDLIQAAEAMIDGPNGIGVALLTQQWTLALDWWPFDGLRLPLTPFQSLDQVQYVDLSGALQTLDPATYVVDDISSPARFCRAWGAYWPPVRPQFGAVRITFTAGWTEAADVPQDLKQAAKLLISHWYQNRDAVVGVENRDSSTELPLGFTRITERYRAGWLA